jgi:hypothetical protein
MGNTDRTKRTISGAGRADVLTASGGIDRPESGDKGTAGIRDDEPVTHPRNLIPRPGPDTKAAPGERHRDDDRPGSQTGTIGGGGPDAHNPSPNRAIGRDEHRRDEMH